MAGNYIRREEPDGKLPLGHPNLGWVVLAVVFAGIWIYAVSREDRRDPEPLWMLLLATLAGGGAMLAAVWVEERLVTDPTVYDGPLLGRVLLAMTVAGPVEEGAKLVAVLAMIRPWRHFDEPMDGIVYAAAAGAGFALAENLAFMEDQPDAILLRGPIGTGAHVLFTAFWGGALGHAGLVKEWPRKVALVALGFAAASVAHGAFDLIVFCSGKELTPPQARVALITLAIGCTLFLRWRTRLALASARFERGSSEL